MSRLFTPAPVRVTRAGTFDGMEKLFFESAAAIEKGETTAPPEALSVPATPLQSGLRTIQGLSLFRKVGLGLAGCVLVAGAILVFGGGSKSTRPAPPAAVTAPTPQPALATFAAPVVKAPAPAALPPVTSRKHTYSQKHFALHARSKHVASPKKKSAARPLSARSR